jgi:hypothetical protein
MKEVRASRFFSNRKPTSLSDAEHSTEMSPMSSVISVTVCQGIMALSSPHDAMLRTESSFREESVPGERNESNQGGIFHA